MKNEILRKITIVMATALLLLTILTIVSFIVVNINDTKEEVEEFAEMSKVQIENFESIDDLDKFVLYKEGSNIRITIITSDGDVIKDTEGKSNLVNQSLKGNYEVAQLLKEDSTTDSIGKIESPYLGTYNMYSYYLKVKTSNQVDPNSFLIVRFSMSNALGSTAFMIMLAALILFWVVMVISLAIIFNFNIKAALSPLEKTQKIMTNIKTGNFIPSSRQNFLIETEADKLVFEIENIGVMINNSIKNLKLLINSVKQGIIAFDVDGNILLKNDQTDNLLGFSAKSKEDFYIVFKQKAIIQDVKDSFNRAQEMSREIEFNNKILKIETIVSNVDNKVNNGIYMLLVLTDITQEKNDAKYKNEFFANASHELKTPLTAISGYSEMMSIDGVSELKIKKCAEQINKNALRMSELIEDMLNLSKLENLDSKVDKENIYIENIVEMVFEELKVIADKNNLKMEQKGSCVVNANKKLMIMLIKNLISNAIKYNKENGLIIVTLEDNKITVEDTGIGIAKEDIDNIFKRFYKVENNSLNKKIESSSGLGLALVSEIVKIHNASIEVTSELDKGSKFVITFNK